VIQNYIPRDSNRRLQAAGCRLTIDVRLHTPTTVMYCSTERDAS